MLEAITAQALTRVIGQARCIQCILQRFEAGRSAVSMVMAVGT